MKNWLLEIRFEPPRGVAGFVETKHITVYARDEDHARILGDSAAEIMKGDWGSDTPDHYIMGATALE